MTAPSNANTLGLEVVAWRWTKQLWNGLSVWYHSTMKPRPKATERIFNLEPLVTAASAQAMIAELEALISKACDLSVEQTDKLLAMHDRATAAEARADRLAKALARLTFLYETEHDADQIRRPDWLVEALQQETQP